MAAELAEDAFLDSAGGQTLSALVSTERRVAQCSMHGVMSLWLIQS